MHKNELKKFLNRLVKQYNHVNFIETDPISVPHLFSLKQDIEIMGLFAAVFAWGQRSTIIAKCKNLISRFDGEPHQFILNHSQIQLKQLVGFKHRTFNDTDLLYFVYFLNHWYKQHNSLETAFAPKPYSHSTVEEALNNFRHHFFNHDVVPQRSYKHISSPKQKSACKRLNMYLRWKVRHDNNGVDFGLWKNIKPHQLVCPLDVHVHRQALQLELMNSHKTDWNAAIELTDNLKKICSTDPVKYDYALFGLGVNAKR